MNVKYENRLVAFIDILGFKEIIKASEFDSTKIQALYDALSFLKGKEKSSEWTLKLIKIEEDAQKKEVKNFDISTKTYCTCFSDSIVVSVQLSESNINEATSTLITNLAYIGAKLMTEGIIVRGAITIGNIIHENSGLVMGQGLIDAYQLETSVAKNPRIIISKKLLDKLNYPITIKRNRYPYHQYLDRFEDGCIGFHQMIYFQVVQSWIEMTSDIMKSELKKIKNTIIAGLDSSFEHAETHNKFSWLKKQYDKLLILNDKNAKEKIYDLNEGIAGKNVHYSYVDNFYFPKNVSL